MKRLQGKTITEREAYLIELATLDERDRIITLLKSVDDELGIFAVGWTMQEIAELINGENE